VQAGLANVITSAAREHSTIVLGIWERYSHDFLGEVGLYSVDYGRGIGELGYWLRQQARGQGYVSEAVRSLASHAFTEVGLSWLEAHIATENLPSRRVAERIGFHIAGHRAPAPHWDGEVGEVLIYALPALAATPSPRLRG
jgi:RimJ/RimL family protein N-acetyltransferase